MSNIHDFIRKNKRKIEILVLILMLIAVPIIKGMYRIQNSNFYPINGDFQNYNPVRRFLAGQIPYKDFAVYLGSGHLFILSVLQLFAKNNFTTSLFVSNMATVIMFELTTFITSYLVLKNKRQALYISTILSVINLARPTFIMNFIDQEFMAGLYIGEGPRKFS